MESVLENVGASERTVDEEFDLHFAKYKTMIVDMNECKMRPCWFISGISPQCRWSGEPRHSESSEGILLGCRAAGKHTFPCA